MIVLFEYKSILTILVVLFLTLKLNADETSMDSDAEVGSQKEKYQPVAENIKDRAEHPGSEDSNQLDSNADDRNGNTKLEQCKKEPVNDENNQNSKQKNENNFKDTKQLNDENQQKEGSEQVLAQSDEQNNSDSIKHDVKLEKPADETPLEASLSEKQSSTALDKNRQSDTHKSKRSGKRKDSDVDEEMEDNEDNEVNEENEDKCDEDEYDDDEYDDSLCETSPECTTPKCTTACPTTTKCTTPCRTTPDCPTTPNCPPATRPRCPVTRRTKCPRAKANRGRTWYSATTEKTRGWEGGENRRLIFKKRKFHSKLDSAGRK